MDLIDQLQVLASRIQKMKDDVQTEEATKNAFVLPFINALGYDIFNPREVVPEFTADVGIKKGEKVDYAIKFNDRPVILFECKKFGTRLDQVVASQLYRYFSVTEARIGIVTDGVVYHFYSDIDQPNKMDEKPFMEFNILEINETLVPELKKLTKSAFDLDASITGASELKYTKEIRRVIGAEFSSPSDEFLRLVIPNIYSGKLTSRVLEQFRDLVKRALHQYMADRINERLKSALASEAAKAGDEAVPEEAAADGAPGGQSERPANGPVTTPEEHEGYLIVKAILRDTVDLSRVTPRDGASYFSVLLDDNNRKPICRLHFNRSQKFLGLFDEAKNEERVLIDDLNDIYKHAARIIAAAGYYAPRTGAEDHIQNGVLALEHEG
ncbi:MAG: type I restriction enzyme HsdR N-terminal domain-containing protein [Bacteroidetes bacterium]|nr:type I restriction enzyme HsdR N-terminal domain-containing protein [Bacteroidota bacterium]